ncbi:MAG: hypothetical protein R2817_13220 [Flavobacteriales bacterium]
MSLPSVSIPTFILLAALIAAVCALRLWRPGTPFARLLMTWVLASAAVEFIGVAGNRFGFVNVRFYNAFILVEFLLLLRIAMLRPVAGLLRPPYVYVVMAAFALVWAFDVYTIGMEVKFAALAFLIGTPVIVAVYLLQLWHLVNTHRDKLSDHAPFWVYLTVLIFYGTVAPILGSVNYFRQFEPQLGRQLITLVSFMSIVKFLLLAIACLRERRHPALPI